MTLIMLISGMLFGASVGIGFWPLFKQPKNLRIQVILTLLGLAGITYFVLSLSK